MLIRYKYAVILSIILTVEGHSINLGSLSGAVQQASGAVQTAQNTANQVVGAYNTLTGLPASVAGALGGQLESVISRVTGGMVKLKCIRPSGSGIGEFDFCKNIQSMGNPFGYFSGKGFKIDLKVCTLSGSTPNIASYYDNLLKQLCKHPQSGSGSGSSASKKVEYNPVVVEVTNLPELQGVSSTSGKVVTDSNKVVYPSGITQAELYGGNGIGYYAYIAKKDRNNPTAIAYMNNDKSTLILKDIAIKSIAKDAESKIGLPKNKDEAIKVTNTKAQARYVEPQIDWAQFMDYVEANLSATFAALPVNQNTTMAEIRKKEYDAWVKFVNSKKVQDTYKKQEDMIKTMFGDIMMLQTADKDYVFDPSQARIDSMPRGIGQPSINKYKYNSLIQLTKETMLKGIMGQAIKYKKALIDMALKKAYICSIPFRERIVRKEMEDVLNNVDSLLP